MRLADVAEGQPREVRAAGVPHQDGGAQGDGVQAGPSLGGQLLVQEHQLHLGRDQLQRVVQHAHVPRVARQLHHPFLALAEHPGGRHSAQARDDGGADRLHPQVRVARHAAVRPFGHRA